MYPRRLFSRVGAVVERSEGSSRVYLYSFNLHMKATTGAAVSESVEWKMKSLCDSRRRRQRINCLCFLMSGFFAWYAEITKSRREFLPSSSQVSSRGRRIFDDYRRWIFHKTVLMKKSFFVIYEMICDKGNDNEVRKIRKAHFYCSVIVSEKLTELD